MPFRKDTSSKAALRPRNKDQIDIMAGILKAVLKCRFAIRSDVIREYDGTLSSLQIKRYIGRLGDEGMVRILYPGLDYRVVKGKVIFHDRKLEGYFRLYDKRITMSGPLRDLMLITQKGLELLSIYDRLSEMLKNDTMMADPPTLLSLT